MEPGTRASSLVASRSVVGRSLADAEVVSLLNWSTVDLLVVEGGTSADERFLTTPSVGKGKAGWRIHRRVVMIQASRWSIFGLGLKGRLQEAASCRIQCWLQKDKSKAPGRRWGMVIPAGIYIS